MKQMDIFGDAEVKTDFDSFYNEYVTQQLQININGSLLHTKAFMPYLKRMYETNNFLNRPEIDNLIRSSYYAYADERDINSQPHRQLGCILENVDAPELINANRYVISALYECCKETGKYLDFEVLTDMAYYLFDTDNDNRKWLYKFIKSITHKDYDDSFTCGLALNIYFTVCYEHFYDYKDNYLVDDLFNICNLIKNGYQAAEAEKIMSMFKGKHYSFEAINIALKDETFFETELPESSFLFELMLSKEKLICDTDLATIIDYYEMITDYIQKADTDVIPYVFAVYNVGICIDSLVKDSGDGSDSGFEMFKALVELTKRASNKCKDAYSFRQNEQTQCIYVDGKSYTVLNYELLFDLLRYVYDYLSLSGINQFNEYDYIAYFIKHWLSGVYNVCKATTNNTQLEHDLSSGFSEIQIICDDKIAYHIPADFFIEYSNEINKWFKSIRCNYCTVKNIRNSETKINTLAIFFENSLGNSYVLRNNPLGYSMDLSSKIRLAFKDNPCNHHSAPILKVLLYEQFEKNGKDPSILETLDVQTILALVQVIVLQTDEVYEALFKRTDSFINGFQLLKWSVRSDDNFYSAIIRYILAASGVYSYYSRNKISKNLKSSAMIRSQEVPLLQEFGGQSTLLNYLREHRDVNISMQGEVIHFD